MMKPDVAGSDRLSGGNGLKSTVALSWRLFRHTVGAKYRKSFLGYFWMVAPAIFITLGVTLANRAGILSAGDTALPFPLFVLLGTLLWQVCAEAVDIAHRAFDGARSYLTRVYFSRSAIILVQFYEALLIMAVRCLLVVLLLFFFNGLELQGLLLVVLSFFGAVTLGLGVGALLMPFTMLFADLHNALKLVLSYGLFLTPALYQPTGDSVFATILRFNPVSPLMLAAREGAANLPLSQPVVLTGVLIAAALTTIAGFAMARLVAPIVIERMLLGGK